MERKPGFYWVRYGDSIVVAELSDGGLWYLTGNDYGHAAEMLDEIAQDPILPNGCKSNYTDVKFCESYNASSGRCKNCISFK